MVLIFVCSPLRGDIEKNQENARRYCKQIADLGCVPICPHIYFTQFLDDNIEAERNIGINSGIELLELCDELWVFGDVISAGMQKEIDYWKSHKIDPTIIWKEK